MTAPTPVVTARRSALAGTVGRGRVRGLLGVGLASATVLAIVVLAVRHQATLVLGAQAAAHASLLWALLAVVAVAVSFCATAYSLAAASGGALPAGRAGMIELAGAFCNRVAPGGVGGTLVRVRALTCAGLPGARAVASVTVIGTAGGLTQVVGITVAALTAPTPSAVPMPGAAAALVAGTALGVAGSAWLLRRRWVRRIPQRWLTHFRELRLQLQVLARDRARLMRVLSGPAISATARVLALWAAAHAVGLGLTVAATALVYLAGTALAGATPVPGGVGPAELTLTAGLITVGAAPGPALAAVLVFRLASFWLPSAAGAASLLWLRHQGALREPGSAATRRRRGPRLAPTRPAAPTLPAAATLPVGEQIQTSDTFPTGPRPQGGGRAADTPWPTLGKGVPAMPITIIRRLTGLSTVQKVLLAGTAATAAAVIGTGAAYAAAPSAPAAAPSTSQSQETTSGPDTDNIQSGDQTGPDTATTGAAAAHTATKTAVHKVAAAVDTPTAGDTTDATGAADTDNVQSGDQTGPDTGGTDTAGSTTGADTDNIQSGDQTGPDTGGSAG